MYYYVVPRPTLPISLNIFLYFTTIVVPVSTGKFPSARSWVLWSHTKSTLALGYSLVLTLLILLSIKRLGESGARVRTGLLWVRSEPNPMDHKKGQVSRKRTSDGCHSKHDDRSKNSTTCTMIEWKGVSGASLPVRSGTGLSPGWVLHRSRPTRWDFASPEPRPQTVTRIVSRVSRRTHLTSQMKFLVFQLG